MGDLISDAWKQLAFYQDSGDLEHLEYLVSAIENLLEWAELKELKEAEDGME